MSVAAGTCAYCGLTLGAGASQAESRPEPRYCCLGCRLAEAAGGGSETGFLEARLLFAAICAMGVMTFSLVLYGPSLAGSQDEALRGVRLIGSWALALFSLPVLFLLAPPLLHGAWADLRQGTLRLDGLVALGVLSAYGVSLFATWRGEGEVYYDTATMLLVLFTLGRRLEAHWRKEGADAARELGELRPAIAHRREADAAIVEVATSALEIGDEVVLEPGEAIPADLVIIDGESEVFAPHLSGESEPRLLRSGEEVGAGAVNGGGRIVGRVLRRGEDDSIGRIHALIAAPKSPTQAERAADRWARVLTATALVLASLAFVFHSQREGVAIGLQVALSVLVVACPCALALATPIASLSTRVDLMRRGVLVREPTALERATELGAVVFDKTGTLVDVESGKLHAGTNRLIDALRRSGIYMEILSGDRAAVVDQLARELGLPARAECTPEAKLTAIEEIRRGHGAVLYAGDGWNDAPVLRAADVGFACGSATDGTRSLADAEGVGPGVEPLGAFLQSASELSGTVRRNLAWCVAYNAIALCAAALGWLHPLVAVLAMSASSATIASSARRPRSEFNSPSRSGFSLRLRQASS